MKKKLSFIIPCYNSHNFLEGTVKEIEDIYENNDTYDYEIVLVNDNLPDETFSCIQKMCKANKKIKGVNLSRNFGQHNALMAGFFVGEGDIFITLDDDGQTPPKEAYKLIEQVEKGHDVAIARYPQKKHSLFRNLGSKLNDAMAKSMIGKPKHLFLSSFVAMKKYIAEQICSYTFPYPYISGMILRATGDIVNVDVNHQERQTGNSGYTMSKLLGLWFSGFTNFSIKPLRIATFLGAVIAVLGFVVGIYSVVVKLSNPDAPLGWASTVSITAFIGGITLLLLGLVGEYIGRIYMGLNQQPQFIIREKINLDEDTH